MTQPRPRSAVAGPVAVAALFLAIIGGSVGFLLGAKDGDAASQPPGPVVEETTQPPETGEPEEPPGEEPVVTPDDDENDGDHCPRHTKALARDAGSSGGLERKRYIRTERSEVWICADSGGRLFYQGHSGKPGERLVEGKNALFLTDVWLEGDAYYARASNVRFKVSNAELVIERDGREPEVQEVVEHRP